LNPKKVLVTHSLAFETMIVLMMRFSGCFMAPDKIHPMEVEDVMKNGVGILKEMIVATLIAVPCHFWWDTERRKQLSYGQTNV
jgi:hypothetical protein